MGQKVHQTDPQKEAGERKDFTGVTAPPLTQISKASPALWAA